MKPGVIYNQDCTEFFMANPPEAMSGELVDQFVDSLAAAGVAALFSNPSGQRINYASTVREPYWLGYDPDGPDDQPFFDGYPKERLPTIRKLLDAMVRLDRLGVDFHARSLARCHHRGMEGWISVRMNDVHDVDLPTSPQLDTFWKQNPDFRRVPYRFSRWFDRQLDYARPEVRQHYWVLLEEIVSRYDLDGLELDFMRFPYHFRIGQELAGGERLTAWLHEVRGLADAAAKRLGHAVRLGVRVPAEPETARQMGLDAVRWAREGLLDLVTIAPFWETSDFNMPVRLWRRLLDGTGVSLAGGLEILVRGHPSGTFSYQTPETAAGAAMAVLYGGAEHVNLFNFFYDMPGQPTGMWTRTAAEQVLRAMASVESLDLLPRRHLLTYHDTRAPGEASNEMLPQTGTLATFRLATGPKPVGRPVSVVLGFALPQDKAAHFTPPRVRVNSVFCTAIPQVHGSSVVYPVPEEALGDEVHAIEVESANDRPLTVNWVEMSIGPAK